MAFCAVPTMKFPIANIKRIYPSALSDEGPGAILREERAVFIHSFSQSYAGYPQGALKLPAATSLCRFLSDAFDEEEAAFLRASAYQSDDPNTPHRFYSASTTDATGERVTGYLSIDVLDGGQESYLRQLAVLPQCQKGGIASALVKCSIDDLPDLQKVTVSYRKTNVAAEAFYRKFGFVTADRCHLTLSPDLYSGMVWCKVH